ncbi:MAG: DNA repair protein RecN [Paludibacteraceae bacterium]|nr:DNA repair protein RecN [Paludibacteraceae bacterium]
MLSHLHIQNYALIAHLDIDFEAGFSVLTGETGAGKSIILGALNLVMGGRADTHAITEGEERCIIEATFVDKGEELLIRRELNRNGRSRSFVNDEVVSMAELKALSTRLIDVHSQHQNLLLADSAFQTEVVDAIAKNTRERQAYTAAYEQYLQAETALRDLRTTADKAQHDADYMMFQLKQLTDANLRDGEQEELEQEEYTLSHAEEIQTHLSEVLETLSGENQSVLQTLRGLHVGEASQELQDRIESCYIELKDIADEAEHLLSHVNADPGRLEEVQERQMLLQTLLRKFNCSTVSELLKEQARLEKQSQLLEHFDDEIARLTREREAAFASMAKAANALTQSRQAACQPIAERLINDLVRLGIAHANMQVVISPAGEYTPTGHDTVDFLFAANLGQSPQRVADVASGGEVARIMLSIKALTADTTALPTIIFDEIDTGISGSVATRMGDIMRRMGAHRQVIAITHLPQIAAFGEQHFKVYKQDTQVRTETHIRPLNRTERIQEIAALLSADNITETALKNAEELLNK